MYQANPHSANDKYSALDSVQLTPSVNNNIFGAKPMDYSIGNMGGIN
jgi:hypothetical protein